MATFEKALQQAKDAAKRLKSNCCIYRVKNGQYLYAVCNNIADNRFETSGHKILVYPCGGTEQL